MVCLPVYAIAEVADPAKGWDRHFKLWLYISIAIWFVVTIPMLYFLVKYRRKREGEDGAYIEGNTGLEILWTVIPIIIIILLGVQSWALLNDYREVPQGAYEARVNGFQYGFEMTYPEGITTINELRVPVGPVKLTLTSRDVIHDFALPKFRVREDMVPGRGTYLWFNAKKPGNYRAYCAELCGPGHSQMLAKVIVMEKEKFNSWIASKKKPAVLVSPIERGKELAKQCLGCHTLTGEFTVGPTFKRIFGRETILEDGTKLIIDEAYLKESIRNPQEKIVKGSDPIMPEYPLSSMPEADLNAMIEYLKTVK